MDSRSLLVRLYNTALSEAKIMYRNSEMQAVESTINDMLAEITSKVFDSIEQAVQCNRQLKKHAIDALDNYFVKKEENKLFEVSSYYEQEFSKLYFKLGLSSMLPENLNLELNNKEKQEKEIYENSNIVLIEKIENKIFNEMRKTLITQLEAHNKNKAVSYLVSVVDPLVRQYLKKLYNDILKNRKIYLSNSFSIDKNYTAIYNNYETLPSIIKQDEERLYACLIAKNLKQAIIEQRGEEPLESKENRMV